MTDDLWEEYPEAAPVIRQAIEEHGTEWVLDNYYEKVHPLGAVMAVPDKHELPFFDEDRHETLTKEELKAMYEARASHREKLRAGSVENEE